MALMSSMYTGVSGLEANSTDLSVIGDNIANANTIGFKGGRAAFEDALSQSLIGGGQVGLGARVQAIQRLVTQGALTNTGLATDLAIQGGGFFVVRGNHNGADGQFYTRAGQFTIDRDGALVNLEGLKVQGYQADATGNITGTLGDLQVGSVSSPPRATANVISHLSLRQAQASTSSANARHQVATSLNSIEAKCFHRARMKSNQQRCDHYEEDQSRCVEFCVRGQSHAVCRKTASRCLRIVFFLVFDFCYAAGARSK